MSGDAHLNIILTGNGRTATYSPPPTIHHPHCWVDQQARVAPMPKAQIFKVTVDRSYLTTHYRSGKQNNRWPDPILPQANRPQTPVQSHCHNPRARDDMSYIQRKRKSEKNLSTESQDSFEIIEIREESDRSIPITPGGSPRTAKKATKTPLKGGSASVSSSSSSLSLSSSSSSSSLSANSRNSPSSRSGSENYNS